SPFLTPICTITLWGGQKVKRKTSALPGGRAAQLTSSAISPTAPAPPLPRGPPGPSHCRPQLPPARGALLYCQSTPTPGATAAAPGACWWDRPGRPSGAPQGCAPAAAALPPAATLPAPFAPSPPPRPPTPSTPEARPRRQTPTPAGSEPAVPPAVSHR